MRIKFFRYYLLALLIFNLAACSTMQNVSVENAMQHSPPRGVDYGSLVQVKTLDRQTAKFRVTAINSNGLGSGSRFYRYADMESLKVEAKNQNKGANTWSIILGVIGVAALVALVANADSVAICSSSPCQDP